MDIQEIQKLYAALPQARALMKLQEDKSVKTVFLQGLVASSVPMLFASMVDTAKAPLVFILQDHEEAGYFYHDLMQLLGHMDAAGNKTSDKVFFFPSSYRRQVKYGQIDAAHEILRTEALTRLSIMSESDRHDVVFLVTYPSAIAQMVVSRKKLDSRRLSLKVDQTIGVMDIAKTLREFGFTETDYVYEPGQFAVRGSIVDVYSFSSELPYRIDFFGDDIDTIRTFEVETQLSRDKKTEVEIVPELATLTEEKVPFLDFLPADSLLVMPDYRFVCDSVERIYNEGFSSQALTEQMEGKTEQEQQEIRESLSKELQLVKPLVFRERAEAFRRVEFSGQASQASISRESRVSRESSVSRESRSSRASISSSTSAATITFHTTPQPLFHKNFELLSQTLDDYRDRGYKIYILADSKKQIARLHDIFESIASGKPSSHSGGEKNEVFIPVDRTVHAGFVDDDLSACFFTDHQIFDRFHKYNLKSDKARSGKMALTMKELQEMEPGDFIVHVDFGIGKFAGLVRVPLPQRNGVSSETGQGGASYQEMIRLVYQRGDIVDVSIHSLYKISKYRRGDSEEQPRLSTLGTGAWDRLKEKAKKRIKDIARDLIKLYAKRRSEKGFAFSADGYMQHELEASFLYEDTPDQSTATADVKHDMEMAKPMDRLVCGDVGFGKTEVAIRAAFKAACDSKQVAVLVPTTVLAFQHFQTFSSRLKGMPVRVEYLSRARSAKKTKEVLADLADGKIDILVGTHKLLGKNVKWHDLGLLIIDEEHKFGVATKEKLRQMKTNVDTLTMTATPIPRTLQFSLMGARDMSIMRTPPPNRYPIQTVVESFSHEVIADAINFEMSRNGQVFFVNDRISNLQALADLIKKYVPDCRIAIGHGQMKPEELEKILLGFIDYDYDVLLSTTIVENGIDISNANTIIINDAHHFGLSDLHQMRGRVGRSNKKAFCYLLAPPLANLNPDARRRLEALETFSDLGSGFNLAMQDLDIRGAGNLLGAEQSGFMEDLGYETYQKILSQAVTELKNEEFSDLYSDTMENGEQIAGDDFVDDCAVESDLEMYFPDTYVPGSAERMLLYRELDNIENDRDLELYRKRLEDRFGTVPREGDELMQVVPLRRHGKALGCEKIMLKQGHMQMQFVSNVNSPYYQSKAFDSVLNYIGRNARRCNLKEKNNKRYMTVSDVHSVGEAVKILLAISSFSSHDGA